MASSQIYDAITAHLKTAMSPTEILDYDQIEPALEQARASFVVVEELFSDDRIVGFGDPSALCMREEASLLMHCFVAAPESSRQARTFAETVQQALRLRTINGVVMQDVSSPDPGDLNDGLWTEMLIIANCRMDRHVARP